MTDIPVGSRTTVPELTQMGLTSGFGMGPGKHHRYDRAPIFLRIGSGYDPALNRFLNWHELMNEGHSLVRCIHEKSSCFIFSAAGLNTSPKLRTYIRSLSTSSSTSNEYVSRFWGGFELRCFQLLSVRAWLPSIALSDNW